MKSSHFPGPVASALRRLAGLLLLTLMAGSAQALTIDATATSSAGAWGGVGGNTWTATAAGSVVSASEIQSRLSGGNDVAIQTVVGDTALTILAALNLQGRALRLESQGDVVFKAPVDAGAGSLTLLYGQGAVAAGNAAQLVASAPVNLSASGQYTTRLGSDGADTQHTIITSLGAEGSSTAADLQGMRGGLSGHYVLGADIDAAATSGWNAGAGFAPIGGTGTPFTGSLDGLGHTIAGLTIYSPANGYLGLFGAVDGAVLRNLQLANVDVQGDVYIGALAGRAGNATISGVSVTSGSVVAARAAGGLVGIVFAPCVVERSHTNIDIPIGVNFTGGLVGIVNSGGALTIRSSYTTGNLAGDGLYAGGLVGIGYAMDISDSYTTGDVTNIGGLYGGGLVGYAPGIAIRNSYSTGAVPGPNYRGGLLGFSLNPAISDSYYATTNAGGGAINSASPFGTPKTRAELETLATFTGSGWDIDDAGGTGKVWRIYEGQTTPLLRDLFAGPLTITPSATKLFDGTNAAPLSYAPASPNASLLGTVSAQSSSSAVGGPYPVTVDLSGVHYHQSGYDIALVPGTLTINGTPPSAPTGAAATPGDASAAVSWTAPANEGTSPITGYIVTGAPGGTCTAVAPATTCTVNGLTNGTPYAFTVTATNSAGTGSASAPAFATPSVWSQPAVPLPGGGTAAVEIGTPPGCQTGVPNFSTIVPPGAPAGATFPLGVFRFTATGAGCANATVSVKITYPAGRLNGLQPYKFGPPSAGASSSWFTHGAVAGDSVTYTVTDNGVGDNNTALAEITDPFAPVLLAAAPGGVASIPTLSEWGVALLSLLVGALGLSRTGRRRRSAAA